MTDRDETIRKLTELADSIMLAKNKDYSAGEWETDPNYNFNEIARLLQGAPITPYTVCMIYFLKHVFSLIKYCKTGTQEGGEGLEGRHVDALNYVRILWSLHGERVEKELEATKDAEFDEESLSVADQPPCKCPTCQRLNADDAVPEESEEEWLDRVNRQVANIHNKPTQL